LQPRGSNTLTLTKLIPRRLHRRTPGIDRQATVVHGHDLRGGCELARGEGPGVEEVTPSTVMVVVEA